MVIMSLIVGVQPSMHASSKIRTLFGASLTAAGAALMIAGGTIDTNPSLTESVGSRFKDIARLATTGQTHWASLSDKRRIQKILTMSLGAALSAWGLWLIKTSSNVKK